ncbi:DNA/RNA non-specific endonuclease, partial [Gluconobacter kondonii]|uniref:DNA/RNA non-specific endonuclease n=1 Tax=Gluconobacter kondonii TaxID=941463 RepID=UPI001B8B7970
MRVRFVTCLIVLAAASSAHADPSSCSHLFAGGKPPAVLSETQRGGTVLLCNNDYAVLASEDTKGPLWSAEDLTEEQIETARKTARKGTFSVDIRLPGSMQATLSDYRRSGYDRGHMPPSGDEPDAASQDQSFLLSNIVPQTAALNRGAWEG